MRRSAMLLISGFAILALTVGAGVSQDTKKPKAKMNMLPMGWKALNLSAEQKKKVYDIQNQYRVKIDQLEDQIEKMKSQAKQESLQVLTDDQKAILRKNATGEELKTPAKTEEKKEVREEKTKTKDAK